MSRYWFQKSRRALHEEAIAGQLEAVQALLDNGEDVNQRDKVFFFLLIVVIIIFRLLV